MKIRGGLLVLSMVVGSLYALGLVALATALVNLRFPAAFQVVAFAVTLGFIGGIWFPEIATKTTLILWRWIGRSWNE